MNIVKHEFDNYDSDGNLVISCEVIYDLGGHEVLVCESTQTVLSGSKPIYASDFYPNSTIVTPDVPGEAFGFIIPKNILQSDNSITHSYRFFTKFLSDRLKLEIPDAVGEAVITELEDGEGQIFARIICQKSDKKSVTLKALFTNYSKDEAAAFFINAIIDGQPEVPSHGIIHGEFHGWTQAFNVKAKSVLELDIILLKPNDWKLANLDF